MKKTFFSVFPFFSVFSVVPLKSFKSLIFHFSLFILLPSPFGEGLGVRLFHFLGRLQLDDVKLEEFIKDLKDLRDFGRFA